MSSASGAYSSRAGFNQSGGGLYITTAALVVDGTTATNVFADPVLSGSGGSTSTALPVVHTTTTFGNYALLTAAGCVIRDMGKTYQVPVNSTGGVTGVPIAMRTFRKFQIVGNTAPAQAAFGVVGGGPAALAGTFYLETMREGQELPGTAPPAPIARYF